MKRCYYLLIPIICFFLILITTHIFDLSNKKNIVPSFYILDGNSSCIQLGIDINNFNKCIKNLSENIVIGYVETEYSGVFQADIIYKNKIILRTYCKNIKGHLKTYNINFYDENFSLKNKHPNDTLTLYLSDTTYDYKEFICKGQNATIYIDFDNDIISFFVSKDSIFINDEKYYKVIEFKLKEIDTGNKIAKIHSIEYNLINFDEIGCYLKKHNLSE